MGFIRVASSLCASGLVVGCAVVAVGMGRAAQQPTAHDATPSPTVASTSSRPATPEPVEPAVASSATSAPVRVALTHVRSAPRAESLSAAPSTTHTTHAAPRPASTHATTPRPSVTTPRATPHRVARPAAPPARPASTHRAAPRPAPHTTAKPAPRPAVRGGSLPLHYSTGSATQVITVVASHSWSTTARLQAWTKASGGGWLKRGKEWTAHVGAQGVGHASETRSVTPAGSFTLTQAFGRYSDPGTSLPYFKTSYRDWWNSHSGSPYYNTHRYSGSSPDENLYGAGTVYNYAAVIDYNTRNAPGGVHAGAGSAFFLHVTDGHPTAGCVSVAQTKLVSMLQWLSPSGHPRILIGVA